MSRVLLGLALSLWLGLGTAQAQPAPEAGPAQAVQAAAPAAAALRGLLPAGAPRGQLAAGGPADLAPAGSGRQPAVGQPLQALAGRGGRGAEQPGGQPAGPQPATPGPRRGTAGPAARHENLILQLDNIPASDAAGALNKLLAGLRDADLLRNEVVIVPVPVTNSLLIAATPQDLREVRRMVAELDRQPPSVRVELLIAEVQQAEGPTASPAPRSGLEDTPSGLRGRRGAGAGPRGQAPRAGAPPSLLEEPGGTEPGGPAEAVRRQLQALQSSGRLRVLSRPQITVVNSQPAYIMVGQSVPTLRALPAKQDGGGPSVTREDLGLIVSLTARVNPSGKVVIELTVEKSRLAPPEQDVAVGVSAEGNPIRLPRIERASMETTVWLADGEPAIIGGLTGQSEPEGSRLLIVVTPHVIMPGP